jgi:hypothetical protein
MDMDIDSDEGQVDTWSGGISGGIPKITTVAPEVDDHNLFFLIINRLLPASLNIGTGFQRMLSLTMC